MAGKRKDATSQMFEATASLKDDTKDAFDSINDNIEKAVEGNKELSKELDSLSDNMEDMRDKTKKVMRDTNEMGVVGASLMGTKGKGSISDQMDDVNDGLGDLSKSIGKTLMGALVGVLGVGLKAGMMFSSLYQWTKPGQLLMSSLPTLFINASLASRTLLGELERLRAVMKMTSNDAIDMGMHMVGASLAMGHSMSDVIDVYTVMARRQAALGKQAEITAKATLKLNDIWQVGAEALDTLHGKAIDLYGAQAKGLENLDAALVHVTRTTAITGQELTAMMASLETVMFRIPKTLRNKIGPEMMASIAAMAGEYKNLWGENINEVVEGFSRALDPFDEQGQRLKAMMVGLGATTAAEIDKMLKSKTGAADFWIAQVDAVQKLKNELGEGRFTQMAGILAEQFGTTREELMRMSELNLDDLRKSAKDTIAAMADTKEFDEAWGRTQGLFNNIWKRLGNIAEALMMAFGEPMLRLVMPLFEAIDWLTTQMVQVASNFEKGERATTAWAIALGAVYQALTFIGFDLLMATLSALWIGIKLGAGFILLYLAEPLLMIAGVAAAVIAGIHLLSAAWDGFMEGIQPGLEIMALAWAEVKEAFAEVSSELFGAAGDFSALGVIWDGLIWLAEKFGKVIGFLAISIASFAAVLIAILKPIILFVGWLLEDVFALMGAIFSTPKDGGFFTWLWDIGIAIVELFLPLEDSAKRLFESFSFMPFDEFRDSIKEADDELTAMLDSITGFFNSDWTEGLQDAWDYAKDFFSWLGNSGVSDILTYMFDIDTAALDRTQITAIPQMAMGGFTTEDTIAQLHSNEAIIPLDKFPEIVGSTVNVNQDDVVAAVKSLERMMSRMMSSSGGNGTSLLARGGI